MHSPCYLNMFNVSLLRDYETYRYFSSDFSLGGLCGYR